MFWSQPVNNHCWGWTSPCGSCYDCKTPVDSPAASPRSHPSHAWASPVPAAGHSPALPACPEAPCLLRTCPSGRPQRGPFASSDVSGLTCSGPRVRPPRGPESPWGSPTAPSLTRARFFPGSLPHCPASASITVTGRRGRGWSRPRSLMTRLCSRGPSESSHCCPPEPRPPLTSISPNFYVNKVKTKCKPRPPASKLQNRFISCFFFSDLKSRLS